MYRITQAYGTVTWQIREMLNINDYESSPASQSNMGFEVVGSQPRVECSQHQAFFAADLSSTLWFGRIHQEMFMVSAYSSIIFHHLPSSSVSFTMLYRGLLLWMELEIATGVCDLRPSNHCRCQESASSCLVHILCGQWPDAAVRNWIKLKGNASGSVYKDFKGYARLYTTLYYYILLWCATQYASLWIWPYGCNFLRTSQKWSKTHCCKMMEGLPLPIHLHSHWRWFGDARWYEYKGCEWIQRGKESKWYLSVNSVNRSRQWKYMKMNDIGGQQILRISADECGRFGCDRMTGMEFRKLSIGSMARSVGTLWQCPGSRMDHTLDSPGAIQSHDDNGDPHATSACDLCELCDLWFGLFGTSLNPSHLQTAPVLLVLWPAWVWLPEDSVIKLVSTLPNFDEIDLKSKIYIYIDR